MSDPRSTTQPMILAIDGDRAALDRTVSVLQRRFGADVHVRGEPSATSATEVLADVAEHGDPVALVRAEGDLPDGSGATLLQGVRTQRPDARRAMLITWGAWANRETAAAVRQAMALGDIDYYVVKPWRSPDEPFVRTVAEYVHEWSRSRGDGPAPITVVADPWSEQAHQIRSLFPAAACRTRPLPRSPTPVWVFGARVMLLARSTRSGVTVTGTSSISPGSAR